MRALTGKEERIPGNGTQLVKKPDSFRNGAQKKVEWDGIKINEKKQHTSVLVYNMCRCFPEVSVYSWPPACLPSGFIHGAAELRSVSFLVMTIRRSHGGSSSSLTPSSFRQQQRVRLEVRYLLQRLSASGSHTSGKLMKFYLERHRQQRESMLHRFVPVWSAL